MREVERYVGAAAQKRVADAAIAAIAGTEEEQKLANLTERLAKSDDNLLK